MLWFLVGAHVLLLFFSQEATALLSCGKPWGIQVCLHSASLCETSVKLVDKIPAWQDRAGVQSSHNIKGTGETVLLSSSVRPSSLSWDISLWPMSLLGLPHQKTHLSIIQPHRAWPGVLSRFHTVQHPRGRASRERQKCLSGLWSCGVAITLVAVAHRGNVCASTWGSPHGWTAYWWSFPSSLCLTPWLFKIKEHFNQDIIRRGCLKENQFFILWE